MLYRNHADDKPIVHATIHQPAVVIGNVQISEKGFVGPNDVIHADEPCPEEKMEAVVIASEVNIQDGGIIHALSPVTPELSQFAGKIRKTNVFPVEVA